MFINKAVVFLLTIRNGFLMIMMMITVLIVTKITIANIYCALP